MKAKVKKYLLRHHLLYGILQMVKYRHDEDYITLMAGLRNDPNILVWHSGKQGSEGNPICLVQAGGANDGFFACVRWMLDGVFFCDQFGFIPVIKFSDDSIYFDNTIEDASNAFEYYFMQPSKFSINSINDKSYIIYKSRNGLLAENLNNGVGYKVTSEYIDKMAEMMAKYIRFNEKVVLQIKKGLSERKVSKEVLGVHIRGTDYKCGYKNHPIYISPETYYNHIKNAMEKHGFTKIYLATDDQEILDKFISLFGTDMVLYAKNNIRGSGSKGIHTSSVGNNYRLGLEVICDMAALAECGGLISGMSQVSLMARIYKKSKGEMFIYDKVLSNGINKKGKTFLYKKVSTDAK